MRGHGNTIVAPDIREAVARAIYTERNAQLLLQTLALNRPIEYLDPSEVQTQGLQPRRPFPATASIAFGRCGSTR